VGREPALPRESLVADPTREGLLAAVAPQVILEIAAPDEPAPTEVTFVRELVRDQDVVFEALAPFAAYA